MSKDLIDRNLQYHAAKNGSAYCDVCGAEFAAEWTTFISMEGAEQANYAVCSVCIAVIKRAIEYQAK